MKIKKYKPYIVSILATLAFGMLSGLIVSDSGRIYEHLIKPPLAPPPIVFPIVWSILYILMGTAAAIVFKSGSKDRYDSLRLYVIQLIANFLWPLIFFGTQKFLFALLWLVVLAVLVFITTKRFYAIDKKAGLLMLPYLVWTIFALYLNAGIYLLN